MIDDGLDLSQHYQQRELTNHNSRISYSTKKAYAGYLQKWIEPRWGRYAVSDVRAIEVELWLKNLDRAPGTRCKIRNLMSLLFNHGPRYDLCECNPIQWVRQSAKRRVAPDILTATEVQNLLANLRLRDTATDFSHISGREYIQSEAQTSVLLLQSLLRADRVNRVPPCPQSYSKRRNGLVPSRSARRGSEEELLGL